jgi:hypothetical protein
MHKPAWILAAMVAALSGSTFAADSDGTNTNHEQFQWARWQGRLSLGSTAPAWQLGVEGAANKLSSASLMGDYYFGRSLFSGPGGLGGFRATSGLVIGQRGVLSTGQPGLGAGSSFSIGSRLFGQAPAPYPAEPNIDNTAMPYLGVGYTGLSVRSGWSFSADLGMVAQSPGSARFGRSLGSSQSLDDAVREMRLSPLLQLGVSYSF